MFKRAIRSSILALISPVSISLATRTSILPLVIFVGWSIRRDLLPQGAGWDGKEDKN